MTVSFLAFASTIIFRLVYRLVQKDHIINWWTYKLVIRYLSDDLTLLRLLFCASGTFCSTFFPCL